LYDVLRIAEFERLSAGTQFAAVEARVTEHVRAGLLELRVDHKSGVLRFEVTTRCCRYNRSPAHRKTNKQTNNVR
jgi:hypothetical protein